MRMCSSGAVFKLVFQDYMLIVSNKKPKFDNCSSWTSKLNLVYILQTNRSNSAGCYSKNLIWSKVHRLIWT